MAIDVGKLSALAVRNAKTGKHFDGGGLYLDVRSNGSKYWRLKYRYSDKERLLAFGAFPEVSLAEARRRRNDARTLLREGRDPGLVRRAEKAAIRVSEANTFEAVAREWLETQKKKLSDSTFAKAEWTLETLAFPWLGSQPITAVTPAGILAAVRRVESRGANETAHRLKQRIQQVFRYAIATQRAERNPASELRDALEPIVSRRRAAITDPASIGELLRDIEGYRGHLVTLCALKLAPLVFVRPGELRRAEWSEIDLEAAEWRIPAAKMKMREEHIVPLAPQAVAILSEINALTGRRRYVFPGVRSVHEPMSENTVNAALRRLGYDKETMCGHGFRALASTRLNEMGFSPDVIERQLAHAERNKVRAAYNRAQYLPERRKMMTAWGYYLDSLRDDTGKVVSIARKARKGANQDGSPARYSPATVGGVT